MKRISKEEIQEAILAGTYEDRFYRVVQAQKESCEEEHREEVKEIFEEIEGQLIWGQVPYLAGDGTMKEWTMHCMSDKDWQALKQKHLGD